MTLENLDTVISFVVILAGVSLLVTILTQTISALLGLRGANLLWGIKTLLKELDPSLTTHAKTIAAAVLHHPLVSDSTLSGIRVWLAQRWSLASAIRKDELIQILRMLADSPAAQAKDGGSADAWAKALATSLDNWMKAPLTISCGLHLKSESYSQTMRLRPTRSFHN